MKFTKETLKRTIRTFFETAIPYIVTHLAIIDFTDTNEIIKRSIIGLIVSAGAAGIAAALNLEKSEEIDDES